MNFKLNSIKDTKTRQRDIRFNENARITIETNKTIENNKLIEQFNESKKFTSDDINTSRRNFKLEESKYKDKANKIKEELICESFAELAYASLPLSEDEELLYGEKIKDIYKESYRYMMYNNMLNTTPSLVYEEYLSPILNIFDNIEDILKEDSTGEELKKAINDASLDMTQFSESKDVISKCVRDKILKVYSDEKFISSNRSTLKEEYKEYHEDSLFNSLSVNCYNDSIHKLMESKGEDYQITDSDKDNIAQNSLFEGLILYNLIECLHTCKLMEGLDDYSKLRKYVYIISK